MALPADLHEQIAQMEARLRLVPADETPPPAEVREQVRLWREHVHEAAESIRWADDTIERFLEVPEQLVAERDRVLGLVRSIREQAFALMQRLNPDQTWFWTEEWQAGEREVDREIASGKPRTIYYSDEEFFAALDAHRRDANA